MLRPDRGAVVRRRTFLRAVLGAAALAVAPLWGGPARAPRYATGGIVKASHLLGERQVGCPLVPIARATKVQRDRNGLTLTIELEPFDPEAFRRLLGRPETRRMVREAIHRSWPRG
jgi:hypothetical protein